MSSNQPAVEMRGITKRFPGVLANDHVDLTVKDGEIHALPAALKLPSLSAVYGTFVTLPAAVASSSSLP